MTHIAIASCRLKAGVTEEAMLAASDEFQARFVKTQEGIIRRILVKGSEPADYADIVFFTDLAAIDRVMEAEQTSEVCAALFALLEGGDHHVYEVVKTYD
ncbi:hypothetical protein KZZ52_22135 [Dactylosporangium sp. AC04546]|uniref:hypothetical protein n=1 Tax=Dactylosporangium sp. AC04546 TaxID=2862460 RepID=UPI001EDD05F2|nr:hypothetical protein [Dactylosporangium sp. AC04546]WVK87979.1 hypothetical protein KZZ52_22135 [Dactylosporangium sp. AC04546]